jgi:hypothetical protein
VRTAAGVAGAVATGATALRWRAGAVLDKAYVPSFYYVSIYTLERKGYFVNIFLF